MIYPRKKKMVQEKEEKKKSKLFNLMIFILTIILLPKSSAATVGHGAQAISEGISESGNYTFPDTVRIEKFK